MTIAICVRVGDGLALAADSATALKVAHAAGAVAIGQIYQGARKLIRPHPAIPLAFVTYGQGTIEDQSIAGLAVGLRHRLEAGGQWELNVDAYTVHAVAERIRDYYAERIAAAVNSGHAPHTAVGFLAAGYSSNAELPEVWETSITEHGVTKCEQVDAALGASVCYRGFTDPLDRLLKGIAPAAEIGLNALGPAGQLLLNNSKLNVATPEMPISEAVNLAKWLADVTVGAMHFGPGAEIVGGKIDLARLDRNDGFVWVQQQTLPFQPDAVDVLP